MMLAHYQSCIQRVLEPFKLTRPPIPDATTFLYGPPPTEMPRFFRESDDDRLRAIMRDYPHRLSQETWQHIATIFGCGVTVRQIQERWHNFAKPGLDRRAFSLTERRQVAALATDHPHEWRWIATQLGDGTHRSAAMVKHCGMNILPKLAQLGFCVESGKDIDLVPDEAFEHGFPKGPKGAALIAEFWAKMGKKAEEAQRDASHEAGEVAVPLMLESLLSRPGRKSNE
jgi:hypothetical protein